MLTRISEILQSPFDTGQNVVYIGGTAGMGYSALISTINEASIADWAGWMCAVAVLGRLIFDIYKYSKGERK